jgi:Fic family protein
MKEMVYNDMKLVDVIQQMDALKAELDQLRPIRGDRLNKLEQKLRLDWNYHSNSMEGNTLSMSETKSFILWGVTAKGKPFRDYLEMKGHNEALQKLYGIIDQDFKITERLIKELHAMILVEAYADEKAEINPGEWKKIPNFLYSPTGERIDFASPEEVPSFMSDLVNWLNNHIDPPKRKKKKYDLHPLLVAAGFHTQFIKIHPFGDGNGRMSRILTNLILMLCGYVPAIIKLEERKDYYTAINTSSLDNPENLAFHLGKAEIHSLEIAIKAAKGERIEEPDDLDKQLSLLEQKLNGAGDVITKVKSEEVLREFGNTTLLEITSKFMVIQRKFKRFYLNINFEMLSYINASSGSYYCTSKKIIEETLKPILMVIMEESIVSSLKNQSNESNYINFECTFNTFNRKNIEPFSYKELLTIEFNEKHFVLKLTGGKQFPFPYNKGFEAEELEGILKISAKEHLAFIEEQNKA